MKCYFCGSSIPHGARVCSNCGHLRSRLVYVHLLGVIGGIAGSFIGFTAYEAAGALLGGFLGIVIFELAARLAFRPRKARPA